MGGPWAENFVERFNRKHESKGGSSVFLGMYKNGATLDMVGKYFGFTRERARQLYNRLGPTDRSNIISNGSIVHRTVVTNPRLSFKFGQIKTKDSAIMIGKKGELIFRKMFAAFKPIHLGNSVDYAIGDLKFEVKYAEKKFRPDPKSKTSYYHFNTSRKQIEECDYFFIATPEKIYIVPHHEIKKTTVYLSPKWDKFMFSPMPDYLKPYIHESYLNP